MGSLCVKDRETLSSSCTSGLRTGSWACLQDLLVIVLTPHAFFPRNTALNTAEFSHSKKVRLFPRWRMAGTKAGKFGGKKRSCAALWGEKMAEDSDEEEGKEGRIREKEKIGK